MTCADDQKGELRSVIWEFDYSRMRMGSQCIIVMIVFVQCYGFWQTVFLCKRGTNWSENVIIWWWWWWEGGIYAFQVQSSKYFIVIVTKTTMWQQQTWQHHIAKKSIEKPEIRSVHTSHTEMCRKHIQYMSEDVGDADRSAHLTQRGDKDLSPGSQSCTNQRNLVSNWILTQRPAARLYNKRGA